MPLKDPEKRKQWSKAYYLKNIEQIKDYKKEWDLKNKDYSKEYQLKNKKHKKQYNKEYNSRPEVKERVKEYKLKNKEYSKEYQKEYYSRPEIKVHKKEYNDNNPQIGLKAKIKQFKKQGVTIKLNHWQYKSALISISKTVRKLHDSKCQICFESAIHNHHILHKSKYPQLSLNINNCIPLCKLHHNEVHGKNLKFFYK